MRSARLLHAFWTVPRVSGAGQDTDQHAPKDRMSIQAIFLENASAGHETVVSRDAICTLAARGAAERPAELRTCPQALCGRRVVWFASLNLAQPCRAAVGAVALLRRLFEKPVQCLTRWRRVVRKCAG